LDKVTDLQQTLLTLHEDSAKKVGTIKRVYLSSATVYAANLLWMSAVLAKIATKSVGRDLQVPPWLCLAIYAFGIALARGFQAMRFRLWLYRTQNNGESEDGKELQAQPTLGQELNTKYIDPGARIRRFLIVVVAFGLFYSSISSATWLYYGVAETVLLAICLSLVFRHL